MPQERIRSLCAGLEQQARDAFGSALAGAEIEWLHTADCRYAGQPASLGVDVDSKLLRGAATAGNALATHIQSGFERNHKRMWNFIKPDQPIVLVNLRVQAKVRTGWRGTVRQTTGATAAAQRQRGVYMDGRMQQLPVYQRAQLAAGQQVQGPAIVEEQSSCIIFNSGQTASIDATGNLRIAL
jgi:N-methylhydantoinase A